MKKAFYLFQLILLVNLHAFAQTPADSAAIAAAADTSWKMGGFIGLNLSQVSLSNWAQGGENSFAVAASVKLYAYYAKNKTEWATDLVTNYSMVETKSDGVSKSDDRIDLNSKLGHKLSKNWLFSGLVNFKSQYAPGYDAVVDDSLTSDLFSPAYITVGLGFTWKPVEYFEVFLSPVTAKWTYVNSPYLSSLGAYGVDSGQHTLTEFGAYLNARFKKDIAKNITLTSKLELFNNYSQKDEDVQGIDVNWDTYLDMKVNDFLTASINALVVYDATIIQKTQFKEIFGIGLGFKFPKVKETVK
jgi:hypothetical protein